MINFDDRKTLVTKIIASGCADKASFVSLFATVAADLQSNYAGRLVQMVPSDVDTHGATFVMWANTYAFAVLSVFDRHSRKDELVVAAIDRALAA
jgi:hypothetical protein